MNINKRLCQFLSAKFFLLSFCYFAHSSISLASISFDYIPNATIGFSWSKYNANNDFNINFNLGNNFYLKLSDKISIFAGINAGTSGKLNNNHNITAQLQNIATNAINTDNNKTGNKVNAVSNNNANNDITQQLADANFKYIKDEYTNAQGYANEIRQNMIQRANEDITTIQDNIDSYMQEIYGEGIFQSENKSSPISINYELVNENINDKLNNNIYLDKYIGDGYISWDEAVAIYNTIIGDGNQTKATFYAQLMTGLQNKPDNFDNDPYNLLLTESGKQQIYATFDRINIVEVNNNITNNIKASILQSKKNDEEGISNIGDIVVNNKISTDDIKTIIQNTENYSNIIALQDKANDDYTGWNEAIQEYKDYIDNKNAELINNGEEPTFVFNEKDAEKYAMIVTGLAEQPTNYNNDPYVILEQERQKAEEIKNNSTNNNQNNEQNNNTDNTATNKNALGDIKEKNVDKNSFRERFNFTIPIGVNIKINEKFALEPYGIIGFNVAQANITESNNVIRQTKVGFTTGVGTRVLLCKELFFVGLEYRFSQNTFEKIKIQSHNVNVSIGIRFNFTTLSNLMQ